MKRTTQISIITFLFLSCSREWSNPLSPDEDQKPDLPTLGLVAHYPFNGNANDESGNENHGTVNGATLTKDRFGVANRAYSFDGIDDFIDIGKSVKPKFPITVSCWIKVENYVNGSAIFRNDLVNSASYRYGLALYVNNNGYLESHVFDGYSAPWNRRSTISKNEVISLGSWYNCVAIFHSHANTVLYLDAINLTTTTEGSGSGMLYSNNNGAIGNRLNSYFNGLIDDIRIYNRELTAEEIHLLFNEINNE